MLYPIKNKLPVHIVTEQNTIYIYIYIFPHTNAPIFLFLAISPSRQTILVDLFMSLGSILALRLSLRWVFYSFSLWPHLWSSLILHLDILTDMQVQRTVAKQSFIQLQKFLVHLLLNMDWWVKNQNLKKATCLRPTIPAQPWTVLPLDAPLDFREIIYVNFEQARKHQKIQPRPGLMSHTHLDV